MDDCGIFYGHLVHFTVFCDILWTFGVISSNLVYFSRFGILYKGKSGNPGLDGSSRLISLLIFPGCDKVRKECSLIQKITYLFRDHDHLRGP
jgi:hypothetical protein